MNNYTLSLADDELAYCKSQLRGYVRRLIQTDMGKSVAKKDHIEAARANLSVLKGQGLPKNTNPIDFCPKCGCLLTANKCINKGCKK